jgi:anti-sigma-K factor RskA
MNHPDPEDLVTFALGEPTDARISHHVTECATCGAEVDRLHEVVAATTRLGHEAVVLERPPDRVWSAILSDVHEEPARTTTAPVAPRPRRRRVLVGALAGFAVGVAITVALVLLLGRDDAEQPPPEAGRTVATGVVRPFEGNGTTSGSVTVVEKNDQRSMQIRLNHTASTDTDFVQAWLLDPSNNHMIALGLMGERSETFSIPEGVDLAAYSSVDISLEPFDGDPQHSATSLARGPLTPQ